MTLTHQQAREFYDRFGRRQDCQRFYEDRAVWTMVGRAAMGRARSVLEFGCGTGRLAESLLDSRLPADARYLGLDVSATMTGIAARRLARFGDRARVGQTDGRMRLSVENASVDRFVATYVLDLLSPPDIRALLKEAHRVLAPGGLLALASLTHGHSAWSRIVERAWMWAYRRWPRRLGGCRPIVLREYVSPPRWTILADKRVNQWGLVSNVLVAERA